MFVISQQIQNKVSERCNHFAVLKYLLHGFFIHCLFFSRYVLERLLVDVQYVESTTRATGEAHYSLECLVLFTASTSLKAWLFQKFSLFKTFYLDRLLLVRWSYVIGNLGWKSTLRYQRGFSQMASIWERRSISCYESGVRINWIWKCVLSFRYP